MTRIDCRILLVALLVISCNKSDKLQSHDQPKAKSGDTYFHYSIWWAFVNKVFDADLSVAELKKNGDTGLGSFNMLNGEMVMVDGIAYRTNIHFYLPDNNDFAAVGFDKQFQYKKD